MQYELKQYDNILLKFSIERIELDKVQYSVDWVNDEYRYLLPIGMTPDADGIKKWLSERTIPKNREYVDRILAQSGLSHGDTMGIINLCKGLSLNDSYWVVEEGFDGKFADYNLYQNKFTRTLALIAYTGYGSNTKKGFTSSPEYTTNGMLRKCWRRISGKIYLYKGGTSGAANTGKEPFSEYYAAQIATAMGISHVDYGLSRWHDSLCSTCELFTDINTSYVPMHKFLSQSGLRETADFLKGLGDDYYDAFVDMLVFDALIYNTDRHYGNFGLLVDNRTNKPIRFAPLFDHGLSLFNYAMDDDVANLSAYAKTRSSAFNASYEEIVKVFITPKQKARLRQMINFKFKKHSRYNLPDSRLQSIQKFLQTRVKELLSL